MRKTFTKLTLTALIVCGFGTAFTAAAFGDKLTLEEYANANSSYDTFQVKPNSYSPSPHELFNEVADKMTESVATYSRLVRKLTHVIRIVEKYGIYCLTKIPIFPVFLFPNKSSNNADFYAERGVKSLVSDWTVSEDSQIVGRSHITNMSYSINLTNSTGTVWNTTVGQGHPDDSLGIWIDSLDSSRNVNVGALGTVNMMLTASWKANAANDDPVWLDGLSDAQKEERRTDGDLRYGGDYSTTIYGDQPELNGGLINMVAYDVTDLMKAMGSEYANIENAFMFTWEDWNWGTQEGKNYTDFDYNDLVYIMTNVTPNIISVTPEPATMLIIGLGLAGLGLAARRRRKK
ncbi:hypothetical protein FACS189443_3400 [Planctomycetales bacterium]|nr:hypothetical protein FACS189443_3400 [Planctomycetales bacterium]